MVNGTDDENVMILLCSAIFSVQKLIVLTNLDKKCCSLIKACGFCSVYPYSN